MGSNGRGSRLLLPRTISGPADVDVGDVAIPGGIELRGKIVDGLTGQGMPDARVVAIRRSLGSERISVTGASTAGDGSFRIHGLPPRRWSAAYALAPQERVSVVVHDACPAPIAST